MRLKITDGHVELAVIRADSKRECAEQLARVQTELADRLQRAERLQVHVWHSESWWNLSEDLSQFFSWIIQAGRATFDETRRFAVAPLSRSDWLYEAASQMERLLDAAGLGRQEIRVAQPGERAPSFCGS